MRISLQNISVSKKLNLLILVQFVTIIAICSVIILENKNQMMHSRQIMAKELVESAYTVADYYYNLSQNTNLSEQDAKTLAVDTIRHMRYDNGKNYFWINDDKPAMIMHPIKPALDGKDLSGVKDPNNIYLFNEMVEITNKNAEGFAHYSWPKPGLDPDKPFNKISYVKKHAPWGWIIGSGIYIDDIENAFFNSIISISGVILLLFMIVGMFGWYVCRDITLPLSRMTKAMQRIGEEQDPQITDGKRRDEIGTIANSLLFLDDKLKEGRELEKQNKIKEQQAEKDKEIEKREALRKLASDFDSNIGGIINAVAAASTELQATAENMSNLINKTRKRSNETANAAKNANDTVQTLNDLAMSIGKIVISIRATAKQTNLLALNATIEAERAGETGRGFAIVAEEVKKLASETSNKTDEIEQQIAAIQDATTSSVSVVQQIISNISEIDSAVTRISHAEKIDNGMGLSSGIDTSFASADAVLEAASELAKLSVDLKSSVDQFVVNLKN